MCSELKSPKIKTRKRKKDNNIAAPTEAIFLELGLVFSKIINLSEVKEKAGY
jgi:hypothetical protein